MTKTAFDVQTTTTKSKSGKVVINDSLLVPKTLPLVVTFPEGYTPNKAQVALAKIMNQYAYQQPKKWKAKQADLVAQLEAAELIPDPVEDEDAPKLTIGKAPKLPGA